MPIKLTIYIPTYNRHEKLRNCLDIIAKEIVGFEDSVFIFVSNNGSTDATREYLESLSFPWLQVRHNVENLGAYVNISQCFNLPVRSEFVWGIGDDDYLMPGAISGILDLIDQFPAADYIFCNTKAFSAEQSAEIMKTYHETGSVNGGAIKSSKYVGTALVDFEKIIDPVIADTLLGEFMCNCFRQSAVSSPDDGIDGDLDKVDWETIDMESIGKLYQPHNTPLLQSFNAETKSVYCDTVRTFNFWGSAEWLGNYDFVFPIIILFLIKQYKARGFISEDKFFDLLNYYYSVMQKPLLRQATGSSSARSFNAPTKAEMFDTAIVYMSRKSQIGA